MRTRNHDLLLRIMELNKIYNMDCLDGLRLLDDNSIDLVVTSPPYDGLRTYNGYSFDFENIAKELFRVVADGGVIVWVVGDMTENGSETLTSFRQALFFKEIGFNMHDTMIYQKANPMPYKHNRYMPCFEYMFVLSKGKPKTFNPILEETVNPNGKLTTTQREKNGEKHKGTGYGKQRNKFRYRYNIWKYNVHPAPYPELLANDHIVSWSNEGDTVLDIFMGSGTTAKMCVLNNRNYIGFELSKEYCDIAEERLKMVN